jgi:hypothetical protein
MESNKTPKLVLQQRRAIPKKPKKDKIKNKLIAQAISA